MFRIKTLAMAAAVSAGVVFAMPVASQAMPASSPVKIQAVNDGNIVDVRHRNRHNRLARYCRYSDDWRCYKRHRQARYYHRYRYYDDEPYYGYYRPYRRPGVGLYLGID